jgi:hypothetical protein
VDAVTPILDKRGIPWRRINLADFPQRLAIGYRVDKDQVGSLMTTGGATPLGEIGSIWYRRTAPFDLPSEIKGEDRRFAKAECQSFIRGLWSNLTQGFWVSAPHLIRGASDKAEQLIRARQAGFDVPATIISNDPEQVRDFCSEMQGIQNVVYKPQNSIMFSRNDVMEVVYTASLDDGHYDRLGEIKNCPGIFQQKLPKRYDIRVTIFGYHLFSVAIYSQDSPGTQIDWRAYSWGGDDDFPRHEPVKLPEGLQKRCLDFVRSYGLEYGAIDFVLTPDGRYVFLELNPNGQWAWIESVTGLPMTNTLVDLLTPRGAKNA